MKKEYTCIICPNGCDIIVEVEIEGTKIISVEGAACEKGDEYIEQELFNPQRNIASLAAVDGGDIPLASVRLTNAVPKAKIFDVINEIKKVRLTAPVKIGQVVIKNVLGFDSDVIATKNVRAIAQDDNGIVF